MRGGSEGGISPPLLSGFAGASERVDLSTRSKAPLPELILLSDEFLGKNETGHSSLKSQQSEFASNRL